MASNAEMDALRIPPVRGLVPLHNAKGRPLAETTVCRWMRLARTAHKVQKIDLLAYGTLPEFVCRVVLYGHFSELAVPLDVDVSLRTDAGGAPEGVAELKEAGLFDVFLCPRRFDAPYLDAWFDACRDLEIPVRLQLEAPFGSALDIDGVADRIADASVVAVNIVAFDPFSAPAPRDASPETGIARMNALAVALDARGIEANLYGLPFCHVQAENLVRAGNTQQFFLDHQQYTHTAFDLAERLYPRSPAIADKAVTMVLLRHTCCYNPVDEFLLDWMLKRHRRLYRISLVLHKLLRHLHIPVATAPKTLDTSSEACAEQVHERCAREQAALGPLCKECRMRRICDRDTKAFRRAFPGLELTPQRGETVVSPQALCADQRKHYDAIDAERRDFPEHQKQLAKAANDIMTGSPPDRELDNPNYHAENTAFVIMPGAVRWYSVTNTEKRSAVISALEAPFTLEVLFGGGIADQIGFAIGRHIRLMCPMIASSHKVALHVDADGHYVLLRDGAPVRPTEFEGQFYLPRRLPTYMDPQLCAVNIDESICMQNVLLWEGERPITGPGRVRFSIVIVCTRRARRLDAALRSLGHQDGVDPEQIEIIVAYVPGFDATDDVIDSFRASFPGIRIIRVPFPEQNAGSKGFMINESLRMAHGEWVVLLDSDILLAPDFFAHLDTVADEFVWAAPEERKMLPHDVTGRILAGEARPWQNWEGTMNGPGEFRKREGKILPIGFCQCIRAHCFDKVKYNEYEHFEGADWEFMVAISEQCGEGQWLDAPAMHLDHGGSQWYGTSAHL